MFGEVPSTLDEELRDSVETWRDQPLPADYEIRISAFVSANESWGPHIRFWGKEDGNCISLESEGDQIDSIVVRVDARAVSKQFIEGIVEFANYIDAVILVVDNLGIIEPTVEAVVGRMSESNASRFVEDPTKFLESVRSGKIKIRGVP
jgi:hypothetical protein